ncbi:MAG: hypothetical protein GW779_06760 [Candidatus Altiarchaeum hamiconexum]|uniref:Uncharacterized protein n=1 Tax=Candidatus Altarchaeum hamiconexum TaxID=1803513 RepID=A0A8J8CFC9_9ARCH|nr:hypothetical protein [Candidatus Altarchaeum hamiconexum]OIQ06364.1 MAG: hypothetical protein AUK59_00105 [Candidatus Altarchaeum sp. CG2_30_32_3053]PIN66932.1 MAG: hypothetical protein COV98_05625 [Candidatus Altarchaeum sp. CG12_big_fil_rev_8_21_14_0_65_33_22]PIV27359.1 MAG: hypothetical protein COS36_05995 [Candidatus Altarchaeum sp. CG03_land_8_20_14_0_80_32_618]PIZ30486.1 MAG: hypothetical protein COY41_03910 [Candidatus Altarchaeum sp. CG_4_10_14_0_8_um_filter_32_851]PJC13341.1 MAG: h
MKGKIISVVQNSVVIKADVRTDIKGGIMYGMDSKGWLDADSSVKFNPNKLLNYEILSDDKVLGKISNVIGKVNDFFLVCDLYDKGITLDMMGEDVEILKRTHNKKKQHIRHKNYKYEKRTSEDNLNRREEKNVKYKKTTWQKQTAKR